MATTPKPVTGNKKKRKKRDQSELIVSSIVKMPLGDLARLAELLFKRDKDAAEFLTKKFSDAYGERANYPPPAQGNEENAGYENAE